MVRRYTPTATPTADEYHTLMPTMNRLLHECVDNGAIYAIVHTKHKGTNHNVRFFHPFYSHHGNHRICEISPYLGLKATRMLADEEEQKETERWLQEGIGWRAKREAFWIKGAYQDPAREALRKISKILQVDMRGINIISLEQLGVRGRVEIEETLRSEV